MTHNHIRNTFKGKIGFQFRNNILIPTRYIFEKPRRDPIGLFLTISIVSLTWLEMDFRTHWCAVYPSKRLLSTAKDYGKTCAASGGDWCTKSNSSNRTRIKYPQNYGTSSNRYMCTDSKCLFQDNPQKPIKFAIYYYFYFTFIIIFFYERTKQSCMFL